MRSLALWLGLILGGALLGQGSYLDAKAWLAQVLIAKSWSKQTASSESAKPWPWMDAHVIAKLSFPKQQQVRFVMNSSSGQALAFGPGHLENTALPTGDGHSMIAGHRDSHFDTLQHTELGDIIEAEDFTGTRVRYRVVEIEIVDTRQSDLQLTDANMLSLITCYPFDEWVPGGPLRYVVNAERL